jgi:hypothetical protein
VQQNVASADRGQPATLARFIEQRIREMGDTPNQFAKRRGINASTFYRYLKGVNRSLREDTLKEVAAGLSMSMSQLTAKGEGEKVDFASLSRRFWHAWARSGRFSGTWTTSAGRRSFKRWWTTCVASQRWCDQHNL